MYRKLKELLPGVKGVSDNIIAVNLDIKGFPGFNSSMDSAAIAEYIREIYLELIDEYFTNVSFFKTTGNGLLLVIPYLVENVQTVTCETVDACFKVMQDFSRISNNAAGGNNEAPQNIGIGVSRGVACRLVSDNQTLDYSGDVLSLASKLMDIAWPAGIVFDDDFDQGFLSSEQKELFEKETVYIAGITGSQPVDIWYVKYFTEVLPMWKQPLPIRVWRIEKDIITLSNLMIIASKKHWVSYTLPSKSCWFGGTSIQIEYPAVIDGNKSGTVTRLMDFRGFNHSAQADKTFVRVNYAGLAKKLLERGVKDECEVIIRIKYQEQ